jgi:hypothetical protein
MIALFNAQVLEVPAAGGNPIQIARGMGELALDGPGNLCFATGSQVLKFNRSQPPVLAYPNTIVGSTSMPKSVSIINNGNALLSLIGLTVGPNFAQAKGPGTLADCAISTSLVPGARCNLSISFTPATAGSLQGAATLTDNAANGNPATQSVVLAGTGQPR